MYFNFLNIQIANNTIYLFIRCNTSNGEIT